MDYDVSNLSSGTGVLPVTKRLIKMAEQKLVAPCKRVIVMTISIYAIIHEPLSTPSTEQTFLQDFLLILKLNNF